MTSQKVTVVGSFLVGLTLRAQRFPAPGETVIAGDFDQGPGGKGSNQAVQAARMGADVEFVGVIGEDDFGDMAMKLYAGEGVGTTHLRRTSDQNTGLGFIILDEAGENRILIDPGATALTTPSDVVAARDRIAASDVMLTQLEIPVEAAVAALSEARMAGVTAILNPAPARELPEEVLAEAGILTPNKVEARMLLGLSPEDAADDGELCRRLLGLGVEVVVLTTGAGGALIATGEGIAAVPSPVVEVVDTTGAGDAFNGSLAAALAAGETLERAVEVAVAAGALACTALGVIPSLPHARDVEARLR